MKKTVTVLVVIGAILLLLLILGPFYILSEGEQSIVIRFGEIVSVQTDAGLKVKVPVVDNVTKFPKKIVAWDGAAQIIPTKQPENQFIWVDTTARWRIVDPILFYTSVTTLNGMHSRLDDLIDSSVRSIVSQNFLIDAIRNTNEIYDSIKAQLAAKTTAQAEALALGDVGQSSDRDRAAQSAEDLETYRISDGKGREALSEEMYVRAKASMEEGTGVNQFGIELIDVVIRQIKYSNDLTESVYQRMIQERNQQAQRIRSEGRGEKDRILGRLDRDVRVIITGAEEEAETIKGQGDAEATRIYANAYGQDQEFFKLWRTLESYKMLLPKFDKTLSTDAEYFDFLYSY